MIHLIFFMHSLAQNLKLEFDPPIFYNIALIDGLTTGYAEYQVTQNGGKKFRHRIEIAHEIDNIYLVVIRKTTENDTDFSFRISGRNENLRNGFDFQIKTVFGSFSINSLGHINDEVSLSRVSDDQLHIKDKNIQVQKHLITYKDGTTTFVWLKKGYGPLGIVQILLKDQRRYTLIDWGNK